MAVEETQIVAILGTLLLNMTPVVIGGVVAVISVYVANRHSHKLAQQAAKLNLKRKKIEQLVDASYRTRHWLEERMKDIARTNESSPSPAYEVKMICKLHFPELNMDAHRLSMATIGYNRWVIKYHQELPKNRKFNQEKLQEMEPFYQELVYSIESITDKAANIINDINKP